MPGGHHSRLRTLSLEFSAALTAASFLRGIEYYLSTTPSARTFSVLLYLFLYAIYQQSKSRQKPTSPDHSPSKGQESTHLRETFSKKPGKQKRPGTEA